MTRSTRRSLLAIAATVLALAFGSSLLTSAAGAKPGPSPNAIEASTLQARAAANTFTQEINFDNAFDTKTYTVRLGQGARTFTARTMDCCIINDHWGVFVNRFGGGRLGVSNPNAANCGTGSATEFSGAASLNGRFLSGKVVQVIVVHCSGVSTFPAGLTVGMSADAPITVRERS